MRYFFQLCNCNIITFILFTSFTYGQQISNSDLKSPADPCAIPRNTDIIHFPIENWDTYSDIFKTAQETIETVTQGVDDTVKFLEQYWEVITKGDDNQNTTSENNTQQSKNNQPTILEKAAYLQFTLAKLIQKNPNSLVFHEFVTQIYDTRYLNNLAPWQTQSIIHPDQLPDLENRRPEHLYYLVREQFPHGLPQRYSNLNADQKYTLAITGGVHTLFFMDQLPVIFPSMSNVDYQKINTEPLHYCDSYYDGLFKICSSSYHMLQVFRAEKLASIVNNLLNMSSSFQQEKPIAILAYRDRHDLSQYFPGKSFYKMPLSCIQPKTE